MVELQQKIVRVVNLNDHTPGSRTDWTRPAQPTDTIPYWKIWSVLRPNIYSNPFPLHDPDDSQERTDVLLQFAAYWYAEEQRPLRNRAFATFPPDAVLGCVCKPKDCHADIIAGYLNWRRYGPKEA